MSDLVAILAPKTTWLEGSAFTATAYFRTRATGSADTPTSIKYRIDCLTTGVVLQDWTTATPGTSVAISVTATHNAIQSDANRNERKQLTVSADHGASDQHRGVFSWTVRNLKGLN